MRTNAAKKAEKTLNFGNLLTKNTFWNKSFINKENLSYQIFVRKLIFLFEKSISNYLIKWGHKNRPLIFLMSHSMICERVFVNMTSNDNQ